MTIEQDNQLAKLKKLIAEQEDVGERFSQLRSNLVDTQYKLQSIELRLRAGNEAIQRLEGFSLDGLVLGLMGQKVHRLAQARLEHAEVEKLYDACADELEGMEREIEGLQRELDSMGNPQDAYQELLAQKWEAIGASEDGGPAQIRDLQRELNLAQDAVKDIQEAIDRGDEVRADLHSEQGMLSTVGKNRLADGKGLLKSMMNASRNGTAADSSERVRQTTRRFHQRVEELISSHNLQYDEDLVQQNKNLEQIAGEFSVSWGAPSACGQESLEHFEEQLRLMDQLLERRRNAIQEQADELEGKLQTIIENA